jgi:hypothetical protein
MADAERERRFRARRAPREPVWWSAYPHQGHYWGLTPEMTVLVAQGYVGLKINAREFAVACLPPGIYRKWLHVKFRADPDLTDTCKEFLSTQEYDALCMTMEDPVVLIQTFHDHYLNRTFNCVLLPLQMRRVGWTYDTNV